jgi:NADPH:quinone reductase-like Zn-dependent oxidoreductase
MRAIVQDQFGAPEVLKLEDVRAPTAGTGEVLVRVIAGSALRRGLPAPEEPRLHRGFVAS